MNGNTLWAGAITKEMQNVKVAFNILPDGTRALIGHQFVQCHVVFNNKMKDFRCKTRLVARCHMTKEPETITYDSTVSTETVRIALMVAALNDLEVKPSDILNAYVQVTVTGKVWTTSGLEFSKDAGKECSDC